MDCALEVRRDVFPKKRGVTIKIKQPNLGSDDFEVENTSSSLFQENRTLLQYEDEIPLENKVKDNDCIDIKRTKENYLECQDQTENFKGEHNLNHEQMDSKKENKQCKRNKMQEKVTTLGNKQNSKHKKFQEDEEEKKLKSPAQEKKKHSIKESKNNHCTNENVLNCQKRQSSSLLNYFQKATPEQLQKEQEKLSKIIVKADIHHIDGTEIIPVISTTPTERIKKKRKVNNSKSVFLDADKIEIISSESITLLTENQDLDHSNLNCNSKLNTTPKSNKLFCNNLTPKTKNKPKWSMKIKLNSTEDSDNSDIVLQDIDSFDDRIFTPRSQIKLRENEKAKLKHNSEEKFEKKDNTKIMKDKSTKDTESLRISNKISPNSSKIVLSSKNEKKIESKDKKMILSPEETAPVIEEIVSKQAKIEKLAPIFKRKTLSKDNTEVTVVEDCLKRKMNEKLAPLFVKRRKPDLETETRQKIVIPEVVDLTDQEKRPKTPVFIPLIFPKISHVTQLNQTNLKEDRCETTFTFKSETSYKPIFNVEKMKFLISHEVISKKIETEIKEMTDIEMQEVVKEIESRCEKAAEIWERISKLGKQTESSNEKGKQIKRKRGRPKKKSNLDKSFEIVEDSSKDVIWTNKYKPMSSKEVIGNEDSVKMLKEWLDGWRSSNEDDKRRDSDDDFYSSDCSRSSLFSKNQVALLIGPHGCGKTSSVYAVAEELGFRVIEVNVSSKRSGKKVLKDLEEATKSHRIRNQSMESFGFGVEKTSSDLKLIPKKTLILLDDIDLVFDEDDGFVNAAFQLASNTKRPIAMTCKNLIPQLSKYSAQQLRINFDSVPCKKASTFIELVSLAETRQKLSSNYAEALTFNGDLRKALLQLQYLLLSGQESFTSIENTRPSLWKEMHNNFYNPMIKKSKINTSKKEKSMDVDATNAGTSLMQQMANTIDNLSLISSLTNRKDVALEPTELLEDGLSLAEKMNEYCSMDTLGMEIHDWIIERCMKKRNSVEFQDMKSSHSMLTKNKRNRNVNKDLAQTVASTLDRRAISMDYLPYVRAICRAEEIRQNSNARRGNRFYHYLQSITTVRSRSFVAACETFQEKKDECE